MLTLHVRFVASELTPGLENGEYCIADGSTVRDLISFCEKQCGVSIPLKNFKMMYPLLNGKPVTLDSVITKGGTVHICRVVMGG